MGCLYSKSISHDINEIDFHIQRDDNRKILMNDYSNNKDNCINTNSLDIKLNLLNNQKPKTDSFKNQSFSKNNILNNNNNDRNKIEISLNNNISEKNVLNNYNEKDDSDFPARTIKNIMYLYYNGIDIKQKIKNKEIKEYENFYLINKNWLNKYKELVEYNKVIKSLPKHNINIIENNITSFVEPQLLKNSYNIKYEPNKLATLKKIKYEPELSNDMIKYPANFEIINKELFELLKKENNNDNDKIMPNNFNNKYNCLLGDNNILICNVNDLLIFSENEKNDDNINYKLKYIFQYDSPNTLKNEIDYIKDLKYLDNYLFNREIDITKDGPQEFIKGSIFINKEKTGISSLTKPPLIGLGNIGATCYMNATLQSLSNVSALTNYI